MKRKTLPQWIGLIMLTAVICASGCKGGNIFGLRGAADDNAGDLILDGEELLRDAKFAEAVTKFNEAKVANPNSSDARYFHAKATLLAAGFSVTQLLRDVTSETQTVGANLPLYSPDASLSQAADEARKTLLYRAAIDIVDDLDPISKGQTSGSFDSTDVALDLAIATYIKGILLLRDTNNDLEIKVPPDFFFDISRIGSGDFGFGNLSGALCPPGATVAEKQANVDNFNRLIHDLAVGDSENPNIVDRVITNLLQAGLISDESSINVTELKDAVEELGNSATFYFINNGVAGNDGIGDNDNDGRTDEEHLNGIDDDNDGLIDEDTIFP